MATEQRQQPPRQFSGRFILVIVLLAVAYAVALWFALNA
jgi:nitrogen fixation protein FixH